MPWPWIPDEMRFFRETTIKNTVIMGWGTFESIGKCPLPRRNNIVLTSKFLPQYYRDNLWFASSINAALELSGQMEKPAFVIGGAAVYRQFVDAGLIDRMLISRIKADYAGNVYFPCTHELCTWSPKLILDNALFDVVEYTKPKV